MKDKSACALNHLVGLLWAKEHKNGSRGEGMKRERERKEKNGTRKQQQRRKIREGQGK